MVAKRTYAGRRRTKPAVWFGNPFDVSMVVLLRKESRPDAIVACVQTFALQVTHARRLAKVLIIDRHNNAST